MFSWYYVRYEHPANGIIENIDAIVQWKEAEDLDLHDNGDMVVDLFQRIDEFANLTKLMKLTLVINGNTYDKINVATFINNLPSLVQILIRTERVTAAQIEEFKSKNEIPSGWNMSHPYYVVYQKN